MKGQVTTGAAVRFASVFGEAFTHRKQLRLRGSEGQEGRVQGTVTAFDAAVRAGDAAAYGSSSHQRQTMRHVQPTVDAFTGGIV